jgi:rhodanese-related sulfurtransferase
MIDEVKSGETQLLDVRTLEEWQEGHAEHAVHIPIDELLNGDTGSLDLGKKIYIYCRSGSRASVATRYLQERGFQAESIGGLRNWLHEGGVLAKS